MAYNRLEVGVIGDGLNLEIVTELLNHQGIIFKEILGNTKEFRFPCVILTERNDKDYEIACKYCVDKKDILSMPDLLPLNTLFLALAGSSDEPYRNNKLMDPIINHYEQKLLKKIKTCYDNLNLPFIQKWFWPNFAKACFVMTHDVDLLVHRKSFPPPRKLNVKYLRYRWQHHKHPSKFYWSNIPEMIAEERKRGVKSTFYFLPDYKTEEQKRLIKLTGLKIDEIFKHLKNAGCEIGLHGSMWSFQSHKKLKKEKSIVEGLSKTSITGIRQHFLNFLVPYTWRYQEEAGFVYDTTFSYNDAIGFRSGICFPYHPFDVLTKTKFGLLELPMSFMDVTTLFTNLARDEILMMLARLRKIVEQFNGVLILNFHSGVNNKEIYSNYEKAYIDSLNYVNNNKHYWIATAGECATWWRKRENANIDIFYSHKSVNCKSSLDMPLLIETGSYSKRVEVKKGNSIIPVGV